MPRLEQLSWLSKQRWHLLLLAFVFIPTLVSSSTSAARKDLLPSDRVRQRPKMWGFIPKIIETSCNIDDSYAALAATNFPKRLIVMGGPASGKGTQCQVIAEKHGLVHLSTGDMLRQAVSSESNNGEASSYISTIKKCMESGKLIPDDIVVRLVLDRLSRPDCQKQGWILDGFPRTANQARALQNAGIYPDVFLLLDVPDDVAIKRACGRRTDPTTGHVYHLDWNPPPNDEIQQRCVVRSDDTVESMKYRIVQFRANVNAVKGCYDNIVKINGLGRPEEVFDDINSSLKLFTQRKHRA